MAGVVEAVGEEVSSLAKGEAVYGCAGGFTGAPHGALADYMPCDARLLASMPEPLSFGEAAALPLVTLTAWEGLLDKGDVRPLQRLLIHGATGGVGHVGLQLAKWRHCEVAVTASSQQKLEIGAKLGADTLINYEEETIDEYVKRCTNGEGFDVVFDTVAGENLRRSVEAARLNGAVATVGVSTADVLRPAQQKGLSLHLVSMLIPMLQNVDRAHHGEILEWTADLVEDDHLRPLVDDRTFTFDEIGDAHAYAEAGEHIGKVVVHHPDA